MKYKTISLGVAEEVAQHIDINDTLDIVIVKEGNSYTVKVLDTSLVDVETISYEEYSKLLEL